MTGRGRAAAGRRLVPALAAIAAASLLAACSASKPAGDYPKTSEYFSESSTGVSASPRVVAYGKPVPKGGGRYMVGKPYRVYGKTYVPKDNPKYSAVGLSSWYGSAFHGRKTANGEIYDMNELTAAHPTLPLPSYARVTNLSNGRSVIVRVNDRGPYSRGRIIDVSQTTAHVLDFKRKGVARVKVEYVGPARMDGLDRQMLLASYRGPAEAGSATMIAAKAQPAPRVVVAAAAPMAAPRLRAPSRGAGAGDPILLAPAAASGDDALGSLILRSGFASSYLPTGRFTKAHEAAAGLAAAGDRAAARPAAVASEAVTIQLGAFADPANAERLRARFGAFGAVAVIERETNGRTVRIVRVSVAAGAVDAALGEARAAGLSGAYVVRK